MCECVRSNVSVCLCANMFVYECRLCKAGAPFVRLRCVSVALANRFYIVIINGFCKRALCLLPLDTTTSM